MTLDCLKKIVKDRQSRVISSGSAPGGYYETSVWVVIVMRAETARFGAAADVVAFYFFAGRR
jgi:hypothetical protein